MFSIVSSNVLDTNASSTTRENWTDMVLFFHNPGVCGTSWYPCGSSHSLRSLLAREPAWGGHRLPFVVPIRQNRFWLSHLGCIVWKCGQGIKQGAFSYTHIWLSVWSGSPPNNFPASNKPLKLSDAPKQSSFQGDFDYIGCQKWNWYWKYLIFSERNSVCAIYFVRAIN